MFCDLRPDVVLLDLGLPGPDGFAEIPFHCPSSEVAASLPLSRSNVMKIENLEKLLENELKDLYSAESQLLKALPKMAKAAVSPRLKEAFTTHLEETEGQVERLEKVSELLEIRLTGKKCKAMEGLLEEGKEVLEAEGPDAVIDTALIAAAQRVEHYEISGYGTARALAEFLGHEEAAGLLQQTLEEEAAADEKLTSIAEDEVMPATAASVAGDEGDEGDDEVVAKGKGKGRGRR
jgi:ferritin-like metal-binding protein YciE